MVNKPVERADEGGHRGLQAGTEIGQHLLAGRQRRQLLDLRRVDRLPIEQSALHCGLLLELLREIRQDLCGRDRIRSKHETGRALQRLARRVRSR